MDIFDLFSFLSQILIGFSLLFGITILYRYLLIQKLKDRKDRIKYTLELCLSDKRVYENILSDKKIPYYKQIENKNNNIVFSEVNEALSYFEKISIGIEKRVYDEEVIRMYYEKYFLMFYDFYKYYILKYREKMDFPFLYIEFEKYVKRWSQDKKNNSIYRGFSNEY